MNSTASSRTPLRLPAERILILDGATGTMIQRLGLTEKDFRGTRFADHPAPLYGDNDLLCLTAPEAVADIHRAYIDAGADIISTDTFNANAISQADYGLASLCREMNREGAAIARREADRAMSEQPGRTVWVAGSIGPTNRTASMSPDVADPGARNVTYGQLLEAYRTQIAGLREGGVDALLFETAFDTLNLKAALHAASLEADASGCHLPIMISATVSDRAGRTLSGQTLEAFAATVERYPDVISLGLNCSFGPDEIETPLRTLHESTHLPLSCHPNAGLPDELGEYRQTPELFSAALQRLAARVPLAVAGGCCGTTPEHIRRLAEALRDIPPASERPRQHRLALTGLERLDITPERNFVNVGERCNVAGSRKFLRLIKEGAYEEALGIARKQVEDGALMLDINMDDAMLDARREMARFLDLLASEPEIAALPIMIDSSDPEVYLEALRHAQGRCIVNSISLKEGEEKFLSLAREIRRYGAAVVVMAFDEQGQADTFERRTEICARSYRLLTEKAGFAPEEIIFDPNIMAVATGMAEHDRYGRDYIDAVAWIKSNLPGALTSGGVSNLSFAFRGHNALREAMHAVFLYHAIRAGLDMGIVNPAMSVTYSDIDPALRSLLERVVLATDPQAPEELAAYAAAGHDKTPEASAAQSAQCELPRHDRLVRAIVKGDASRLDADLAEELAAGTTAVDIIQGPLMEGMTETGRLFGEGKMFLPQVIKTARTMKQAVDFLRPHMAGPTDANAPKAGKIVFATVKGDVHDIGKNIVSIVLSCNNFEVIDLGVMVPAEEIVATVRRERPDLVCLSGLITPSLGEMVKVAEALQREGLDVPLIVGGATTSALHTALKIAPAYHAPVVHATDASSTPLIASALLGDSRESFISRLGSEQESLRSGHAVSSRDEAAQRLTLADARARRLPQPSAPAPAPRIADWTRTDIPLSDVIPLINWKFFFHAWGIHGAWMAGIPLDDCEGCRAAWIAAAGADADKARQALRLYDDARARLRDLAADPDCRVSAAVRILPASASDEAITAGGVTLPMMRQQTPGEDGHTLSLTDFIAPQNDFIGLFAITAGPRPAAIAERLEAEGDNYGALLTRTLADRIAEAASEHIHRLTRRELWGYAPQESLSTRELFAGAYTGLRPAVGYPSMPDQTLALEMARLLPLADIGVSVTENGALTPQSTVMGLYIADPRSRYFMVGSIDSDQTAAYAAARGLTEERLGAILGKNI